MTDFMFTPPSGETQVSWDDPAVWSGGVVPSGSNADVVIAASGANAALDTVTIGPAESYGIDSLEVEGPAVVLEGKLSVATNVQLQGNGGVVLEGGELSATADGITIGTLSQISGNGEIVGSVLDAGNIAVLPTTTGLARLFIAGDVNGSGTLAIGSGPVPKSGGYELELGGADSAGVVFGALGGLLVLDQPQQFTGTITPGVVASGNGDTPGLGNPPPVDEVLLAGLSISDAASATYGGNAEGGTLAITSSAGASVSLNFVGNLNTSNFLLSAGPTLANGQTSLLVDVTPGIAAPTLGLSLGNGRSASFGIVNTGTPVVTGTIPATATVQLTADGSVAEGNAPVAPGTSDGMSSTYTTTLPTALAPGGHQIVASASSVNGDADSDPLALLVLPSPVDGVTTAAISSYQLSFLLGQGAATQFVAGTEAIGLTDGTLSVGPDTGSALVQRLYEGLLNRGGDTAGLVGFTATLATSGAAAVATGMLDSPEFAALHGAPGAGSDTGFVTMLYAGLLGRTPDPAGLAANLQVLADGVSRAGLAAAIADSPEAKAYLSADTGNVWVPDADGALVTQLFETGLARAPDSGGEAAFIAALHGGQSAQQVAAAIAASPEFLADHAGQSNAALVTSLYNDGLGRSPDAAGLQQWVSALQAGGSTPAAGVLLGIATSPEAYAHLLRTV